MGKSANILGGASLVGTVAKTYAGGQGAFPGEELPKVLRHLGLTDYLIANEHGKLPTEQAKKRPHFVVCKGTGRNPMGAPPRFRPVTYEYMCCSVTIGNSKASNTQQHKYHAVTGFMCDGKGYLFDSNQRKHFPCNWWSYPSLRKVVTEEVARFYDFFAGGQIDYFAYNYVIFSRNDYIKTIHPVCRLKYKKTRTPLEYVYGSSINEEMLKKFNPAQVAAIKRAKARHNASSYKLNKAFYDSLLNTSKSRANALETIREMKRAGYRSNLGLQLKFLNQLSKKFNKSPASTYANAKNQMSKAIHKYQRQAIYSKVFKKLPVHQRKVLAHYRDEGVWIANNTFVKKTPPFKGPIKRKPKNPSPKRSPSIPLPIPLNSPRTERRKNIENKFNTYWKQLNKTNRNTVRNYISRHKSPSLKPKSPSPKPNSPSQMNLLRNINSLKTAKARAEWIKAKKHFLKPEVLKAVKSYVRNKNQANRNRREAKRFKIVKS
jgi:hypothetical protein